MTLTALFNKSILVSSVSFLLYFSSSLSPGNATRKDTDLVSKERATTASPAVLVFSKTNGYRHKSIEAGKVAFTKMASEKNFTVEFTEDSTQFNPENLKRFKAVVFLNTTGNVLGDQEQTAFEKFIQAGGGYVGIHSATDCEYNWEWYGKLAGAYFLNHPGPKNVLEGRFYVVDNNHPTTNGMPAEFKRSDEFYSFKNINPAINVLIKIDEKSYVGGKNGDNHPMSWYHDYDGGRAFYTAMGHTDESFVEPLFLNHVYAGLQYAIGK